MSLKRLRPAIGALNAAYQALADLIGEHRMQPENVREEILEHMQKIEVAAMKVAKEAQDVKDVPNRRGFTGARASASHPAAPSPQGPKAP